MQNKSSGFGSVHYIVLRVINTAYSVSYVISSLDIFHSDLTKDSKMHS